MKKEMHEMVQLFESMMMIVFGLSWPVNIAKSLRSRTTLGKSIGYEYMVMLGYTCGVIAKLISWQETGTLPYSLIFYIVDIALVSTDVVIYYRNRRIDKKLGRL